MIVSIVIYLSKIFEVNDMFDFEKTPRSSPMSQEYISCTIRGIILYM